MPPRGVKKGTKLARQYEHIKDSERKQGRSTSRAKEIAARTVNKERARSGQSRTAIAHVHTRHVLEPPRRPPLRHEPAQGPDEGAALQRGPPMNIAGRSKMNKAQLQRAVDRKKTR